jgi:hypothetical protein
MSFALQCHDLGSLVSGSVFFVLGVVCRPLNGRMYEKVRFEL